MPGVHRQEEAVMIVKVQRLLMCLGVTVCGAAGAARVADRVARPEATIDSLRIEVEALRAPGVAWRGINWKSCLLEGLMEARAKRKPALLWVFIDRPVDDERC